MLAGIYCVVFLLGGLMQVRWLLPRHRALNRVWLGLCLGLLEMMWFPALCAFALRFSMEAHGAAAGVLALVTLGVYFLRDKRLALPWDAEETRQLRQAAWLVIPLTVYSGYLQYTHVIRLAADGSYHVGQSTYGDLPMHLSFITSLKNASFPPEYSFYPGHRLSYPFLMDSLSTSFLMMGLCYLGVVLLAREMTLGKKTIALAALLFFLNGGLGFLYDFDQAAGLEADGTPTVLVRLRNILEGYYQTPTNKPEPDNLRWSNVIVDLMVPQRTLLGGWCMVIPCFYLLYTAFDPRKRASRGHAGNPSGWPRGNPGGGSSGRMGRWTAADSYPLFSGAGAVFRGHADIRSVPGRGTMGAVAALPALWGHCGGACGAAAALLHL